MHSLLKRTCLGGSLTGNCTGIKAAAVLQPRSAPAQAQAAQAAQGAQAAQTAQAQAARAAERARAAQAARAQVAQVARAAQEGQQASRAQAARVAQGALAAQRPIRNWRALLHRADTVPCQLCGHRALASNGEDVYDSTEHLNIANTGHVV